MDPWADSSAAWSPEEVVRTRSPRPLPEVSSTYAAGPVDPWAEPSSSSSIPVVSTQRRVSNGSENYPRDARSGSVGDFDPWGGNSAPVAPLSTALQSDEPTGRELSNKDDDAHRAHWTGAEPDTEEKARSRISGEGRHDTITTPEEREVESVAVDDDDPWGSGAAARRIKAQQEAESAAQRMEILRLQEEAKGKQIDDAGNEVEAKYDEVTEVDSSKEEKKVQAASEAPVASGWRSLFGRVGVKAATAEEDKATKEAPKVDTSAAAKDSPRSATALPAPRLWQAPAILGAHTRSSSSSSRTEAFKEPTPIAPSATPPIKGPGWEVTTKKQPTSGGGGLIQSIFGSSSTATNDDDKGTSRKEKTTGLSRFGRGMQPPPIVSAADEEDESFDTSETGIEWEAGNAFDGKDKQLDLLSDDADTKPAESTVGKLLGRWRGKETPAKTSAEDLSKADFSWLESVGQSDQSKEETTKVDDKPDWLDFIGNSSNATAASSITPLARSNSDRLRISSTSRGTANNTTIPTLAPPTAANTKAGPSQKNASPFSFRGPGTSMASSLSASRLASKASARSTSTLDTFGDLLDDNPIPNDGYRDDVTDNDAALLQGRPVQARKTSGFLRGLQGQGRGSKYDYDEDDVGSHDDSWTAFRDQDQSTHSTPYQDSERRHAVSPPLASSAATVARSKSGSSSMTVPSRPGSGALPLPPPPSTTWNRNGPLLPPPGRPQSTDQIKASSQTPPPAALPPTKPKTLSQGKTLTNDDLSFFENL